MPFAGKITNSTLHNINYVIHLYRSCLHYIYQNVMFLEYMYIHMLIINAIRVYAPVCLMSGDRMVGFLSVLIVW